MPLSLVPLADDSGTWVCSDVDLRGPDHLVLRFELASAGAWLAVSVLSVTSPGPVIKRLSHCAVRYDGDIPNDAKAAKKSAGQLVFAVAQGLNSRLAAGAANIAAALRGSAEQRALTFSRATLAGLLLPSIRTGEPVAGGWILNDIYPTSHIEEPGSRAMELVLDFLHATAGRFRFVVGQRKEGQRAFRATEHFAIRYLRGQGAEPEGVSLLKGLVGVVLQLADHPGLTVTFPDVSADVAGLLPAAEEDVTASLNLSISSDCHQSCAFCSVKQWEPPTDGDDALTARLRADLTSARARGIRHVRLNGYDPLTWPSALDLVRYATALGYRRMDVFSPATRLASSDFCDALLSAMPPERRFVIPVYGATAQTHDEVVGRPGAHALMKQAVANLTARGVELQFQAVVTPQNLGEIRQLCQQMGDQGHFVSLHLPYPTTEAKSDRYFDVALTHREIAEALADQLVADGPVDVCGRARAWRVGGLSPCVQLRVFRHRGLEPAIWLDPSDEPAKITGTEYRDERFQHRSEAAGQGIFAPPTVPCAWAGQCSLASECPKEHLRAYVEACGVLDILPVSVAELVGLPLTRQG